VVKDPQIKGFPIALIIELLMVVVPMIFKCMKERSAAEVQSRLAASYQHGTYDKTTLRRITALVKWQALTRFHLMSSDQAEIIAIKALDDARVQPDTVISAMIREND
jgi:hypothetical protein